MSAEFHSCGITIGGGMEVLGGLDDGGLNDYGQVTDTSGVNTL